MAGGPADPAMLKRLLNGEFGGNFSHFGNLTADFVSDVLGFYHAVDWSEPWLLALAGFHIIVWMIAVLGRQAEMIQMVLLLTVLAAVYGAEYINRYASHNW